MEERTHLVGVYGDNFLQEGKFKISFLPIAPHSTDTVNKITILEPELLKKKEVMSTFQQEYMDLKRRWEAAKERLKKEETEVTDMLKQRETIYEELVKESEVAFGPTPSELATQNKSGGFFGKFFG